VERLIVNPRVEHISVNGLQTRYVEAGSGDNILVLIHGGDYDYRGSVTSEDWSANIPDLAGRLGYHVYAIDKLGAGGTDSPVSDDAYTMRSVIDHTWATITTLGISRFAVVGHSRGGLAATRIALDHADVVTSLIVIDSNTLAAEDPVVPLDFYERPYTRPTQVGTPETLTELTQSNAYKDSEALEAVLARKIEMMQQGHPERPATEQAVERVKRLSRERFLPDMREQKYAALDRIRAGELQVPTLLFWGLNDPSAPLRIGFDLYQLMGMNAPEVQMHVFNQCGHWVHVEHMDDFNDVMHTFLLRHQATPLP
jgi:2-hydroxy-6-oxonona-2,4-dienedioate hydrolase